MSSSVVVLLGVLTACLGSFVTWKIAKRNASGAIDTSVASDLWAEGGQIRTELRAELAETKEALKDALKAVLELRDEIRLSRQQTDDAREETLELKKHLVSLTEQIINLKETQTEALKEVKTGNTLTIAELADNAETRRILDILKKDRTAKETEHLNTASDRLPDDLAADQTKDKETS